MRVALQPKVALVHDYLREFGGAERVLEALHEIFPQAPIYTAYANLHGLGQAASRIKKWDLRTSWLQKLPFANKLVSPLRILAPMIFEGFDLSEYDLVISSANVYFAKAVITKPATLHISYIHTPPRYLYGYTTSFNYKKHWWTRVGGELINHFLRLYDFETSQRPDILIANSQNVRERIKKFYRRDAVVIYPPVDTMSFPRKRESRNNSSNGSPIRSGMTKEGKYFLSVSRLVRGKGVEVIVEACSKLGLPLKVVGDGPELENLKSQISNLKSSNIEFLGEVEDKELAEIYANAKALIATSEDEDFGMTVVESMATGTPVIAARAGGYLETVIEGKTGEFFELTGKPVSHKEYVDWGLVDNLVEVLKKFDPAKYSPAVLKKQAQQFSKERFKKEILELIKKICPHGI